MLKVLRPIATVPRSETLARCFLSARLDPARRKRCGKDYVSLSLVAPEFGPRKLYANLGRAAGQHDEDVLASFGTGRLGEKRWPLALCTGPFFFLVFGGSVLGHGWARFV